MRRFAIIWKIPTLGGLDAPAYLRGTPLRVRGTGYLQYLDMGALDKLGQELDVIFHVRVRPGSRLHPAAIVAVAPKTLLLDSVCRDRFKKAFVIGKDRMFARDPLFGLTVLAEIAGRALPADPGTAVRVLEALGRIFITTCGMFGEKVPSAKAASDPVHQDRAGGNAGSVDASFAHVSLVIYPMEDFVVDTFDVIARAGASDYEVMLRMQEVLAAVAENCPDPLRAAVKKQALRAWLRASAADKLADADVAAVRRLAMETSAGYGEEDVRASVSLPEKQEHPARIFGNILV